MPGDPSGSHPGAFSPLGTLAARGASVFAALNLGTLYDWELSLAPDRPSPYQKPSENWAYLDYSISF